MIGRDCRYLADVGVEVLGVEEDSGGAGDGDNIKDDGGDLDGVTGAWDVAYRGEIFGLSSSFCIFCSYSRNYSPGDLICGEIRELDNTSLLVGREQIPAHFFNSELPINFLIPKANLRLGDQRVRRNRLQYRDISLHRSST